MNELVSLELKEPETSRIISITIDADRINPSWKIGDIVRIDLDDVRTDIDTAGIFPDSIHGTYEITSGIYIDYVDIN